MEMHFPSTWGEVMAGRGVVSPFLLFASLLLVISRITEIIWEITARTRGQLEIKNVAPYATLYSFTVDACFKKFVRYAVHKKCN